ncbi:Glycinol 4-dimethylallyltransferase [Glycine soja]
MDRALVMSSPNVCSVTNGGNLWRRKHSTNNYNYPSLQQKRKTQIEYNILRSQSLNHHYKCIEGGRTYQESNIKYVVKAAPAIPSFGSESHASSPKNIFDSVKNFLAILYNFCYPYTMIGRINKPYLPLPSGKLSFTNAVFITVSSAVLSFGLSSIIGSRPLIWSLVLCFLPWTGYSVNVPMLRWKRYPLLAAMIIFFSWGIIFPITFFLHMQTFVFKRPVIFPRSLIVTIVFSSLYAIGIALSKVKNRYVFQMQHLRRIGYALLYSSWLFLINFCQVFWICVSLFEMAFGVAFLAGVTSSACLWIKIVTGLGNVILASILWYQTKYVDLTSPASTRSFYMLIWKLFDAAYFLLPFIR